LSGNVTIASSLLGTTTIPHVFPSKPIDSKIPFTCKHGVIITGIGVTRDDHLLLCNWSSSDVMVLSDDGKQLNDIGLEGKTWGIALRRSPSLLIMHITPLLPSTISLSIKVKHKLRIVPLNQPFKTSLSSIQK
jgi:hypothetical protein